MMGGGGKGEATREEASKDMPRGTHLTAVYLALFFKEPHQLVKDVYRDGTNEYYCAFWFISMQVSYKTERAGGDFQGDTIITGQFPILEDLWVV